MLNLNLTTSNGHSLPAEPDRPAPGNGLAPMHEPSSRLWQVDRYLFFLRKNWWIVALSVVAFCALGMALNRWLPQTYSSTARLWMPGSIKVADTAVYEDRNEAQTIGATQAELIGSDLIQNRAFDALQAAGVAIPTNAQGLRVPAKLRIIQVARTSVLEITARGPSASYTQAFLNGSMDSLLAYVNEVHESQSTITFASLSAQIALKEAELKAGQDKLTAYMRTNNVPVLEARAKAASTSLSEMLTESSRLSWEYKLLKAVCDGGAGAGALNPTSMMAITGDTASGSKGASPADSALNTASASYAEAQREVAKLKLMRDSFTNYFRPEHPKMIKLNGEISQIEGLSDSLLRQNREQLLASLNMVELKKAATEDAIKDWEAKVNDASERIADFERVKLDVERMRSYYDHLVVMLQNVDVSRNLPRYSISILDRASTPKAGKLPGSLILALAAIVGVFSGLALVRLVEFYSDKVTSLDYLAHHFGERVVGHIPEAAKDRKKKAQSPLELDDDRYLFAEHYRNIRSTLLFGVRNAEVPRVILVTSAVPKEGKSTVAVNLARTIADGGSRVLLIDSDMRLGGLHSLFQFPSSPGLAEALSQDPGLSPQEVQLDSFVRPTRVKNLFLLPCGRAVGNMGDLLLRPALNRLLLAARQAYDFVIVDSVPILAADDTPSLAPKTDGVIFVVRDSFTRSTAAGLALRTLYARHVAVLGIVFNRVSGGSKFSYNQYSEYYGRPQTVDLKDEVALPS